MDEGGAGGGGGASSQRRGGFEWTPASITMRITDPNSSNDETSMVIDGNGGPHIQKHDPPFFRARCWEGEEETKLH